MKDALKDAVSAVWGFERQHGSMPGVIIIRGAQGTEKSTLAKELADFLWDGARRPIVYETDTLHMIGDGGRYTWDRSTHLAALRLAGTQARLLNEKFGVPVVFPEVLGSLEEYNEAWPPATNDTAVPYALVLRATGEYENMHGVPEEEVKEDRANMIDIPGEVTLRP